MGLQFKCPQIGAVVVGIDVEFTYTKAAHALLYLNRHKMESHSNKVTGGTPTAAAAAAAAAADSKTPAVAEKECVFVSTNQDSTVPILDVLLPGLHRCSNAY